MERVYFHVTLGSSEVSSINFKNVSEVSAVLIVFSLEAGILIGNLRVEFI